MRSEADTLQPQASLDNADTTHQAESKTLKAATEMSEAEKVALIQLQAAKITAEASHKSAQIFCVAIVLASVLGCLVLVGGFVWGFAGTFSRAVDTSREVAQTFSRAVDTSGDVAQTLRRVADYSEMTCSWVIGQPVQSPPQSVVQPASAVITAAVQQRFQVAWKWVWVSLAPVGMHIIQTVITGSTELKIKAGIDCLAFALTWAFGPR